MVKLKKIVQKKGACHPSSNITSIYVIIKIGKIETNILKTKSKKFQIETNRE